MPSFHLISVNVYSRALRLITFDFQWSFPLSKFMKTRLRWKNNRATFVFYSDSLIDDNDWWRTVLSFKFNACTIRLSCPTQKILNSLPAWLCQGLVQITFNCSIFCWIIFIIQENPMLKTAWVHDVKINDKLSLRETSIFSWINYRGKKASRFIMATIFI